jgi:hypothetical protein
MRRLGQSQTVCLINFDHVGTYFLRRFMVTIVFLPIAKVAKVRYRTKLILTIETRLFQQQDLFTWEHTGE